MLTLTNKMRAALVLGAALCLAILVSVPALAEDEGADSGSTEPATVTEEVVSADEGGEAAVVDQEVPIRDNEAPPAADELPVVEPGQEEPMVIAPAPGDATIGDDSVIAPAPDSAEESVIAPAPGSDETPDSTWAWVPEALIAAAVVVLIMGAALLATRIRHRAQPLAH